jgi:hypothetical protein
VFTVTMKYVEFGIWKSDTFGAEGCCTVLLAKLVVSQARPCSARGCSAERSPDPLGAAFSLRYGGAKARKSDA